MTLSRDREDREFTKFVDTDGETSVRTNLVGMDGTQTDVIPVNGQNGLVVMTPGHVSTDNSTNSVLAADATYTGTWEDITNTGVVMILIHADQVSATGGLIIEFSADLSSVDSTDTYTYAVTNVGKTYSFQAAAKYYRIRYTNGSTIQTHFHLQTILKPYYVKPSSHRIGDNISPEDDAELIKAVLTGKNPAGTFVNVTTTISGNLKFSLEEYDDASNPVRKDMEGGGKISVGTTAVEATFTGTPTHSIIITADSANTGILYIGKSNVTNTGANAITFLKRYDSVEISYDDVDNAVYVVSDTASQSFWKGALI